MRFLAVNTIGLTGAEILVAELARHPDVLMLPGQNFIGFESRTYRRHDYSGWDAHEIFTSLDKHHVTRAGRVWSGLTKAMTPDMLAGYDHDVHEAEFVRRAADAVTTIDHFRNYTLAFGSATGRDPEAATSWGFFGFNMVLVADRYPDFLEDSVVADFVAPIDYWLANIGQRAVWNCVGATRFWLTNMLYVRRWANRHPEHYLRIGLREFTANPEAALARLVELTGLTSAPGEVPPGFVAYDPAVIEGTEKIAADLDEIYRGWAEYDIAVNFDDWADAFLSAPGTDAALDRFESFWNTTSHTNLDWAGPIAEQIVAAAVAFTGAENAPNVSRWFYHEAFDLNSDNWEHPVGTLEHYLGDLEDEIVVPQTAAHAWIILRYLENVAANTIKRAYSAVHLRETSLYRRLFGQNNFGKWALVARVAEVEARIDEAEVAISKFFA